MDKSTKACTFIGNAEIHIDSVLLEKAKDIIVNLIENENVTEFYCGGYGDFDVAMAHLVKELKAVYQNIKSFYITPYNNVIQEKKLKYISSLNIYNDIIYPELEHVPLKFCITKRNEWMVNNSDFALAYVPHTFGGAYKTLKYAEKKLKLYIL